ncbi:MAG: hypothetical protein J6P71_07365, partial [Oscillospiraceae bacterium]|nr:hypothetical protein [Oscillospiraceae bacterium]
MAKHKNLKRALSLLLALCFVMSFFTVALADEAEEFGYDETVQDDTAIEGGVFDPGDEADQDASEAEDN